MKPLILIVDDDMDYRDDLLPEFVRTKLNGEARMAKDIDSGLKLIAEHGSTSPDRAYLVILDMHMPADEKTAVDQNNPDAGVISLLLKANYKLGACPSVIFTAYPTYTNCAASIRAGAQAYIPKSEIEFPDGSLEGGIKHLERVCLELLKSQEPRGQADLPAPPQSIPADDWFMVNYQWLRQDFAGKWVSFVSEAAAKTRKLQGSSKIKYTLRDGLEVLSGDSYEVVRQEILSSPEYYQSYPPIVPIPATSDANIIKGGL